MSFVRIGLSAIPRTIRRPVTRLRIPIMVKRRGMGDDSCLPGMVLDTRTDPPHCILERFQGLIPQVARDYPEAPGCHVVDLSRNACQYIDGTEGGCNSMPECDPLTKAIHFQYGLPIPTNTAIPALKTGNFTPSPFTNAPDPNLRNPTGGTIFTPSTQTAVQAAIANALGKDQVKAFQSAVSPASNTPAANTPGGNAANRQPDVSSSAVASSSSLSFLTNPVSVFGFSIPTWGIVAALGFGLYAFAGKHR